MARPWTPGDLPAGSVKGWWDYSDAATVTLGGGGAVVSVADKSGNGRTMTAGGIVGYSTDGPGGRGIVTLAQSRLSAPAAAGTFAIGLSLASVWRKVGGGTEYNAGPLTRSTGGTPDPLDMWDTNRFAGGAASFELVTNARSLESDSTFGAWNSFICVLTTARSYVEYVNAAAESAFTSGPYSDGANKLIAGSRDDAVTSANMQIGEQVATVPLAAADREMLEGYFAHRWGMQALLPAGHPYKAAAPMVASGPTLSVSPATVTSTTTPVQLLHGYRLPVTPAVISATTSSVATRATRRLPVATAAFALATMAVAIIRGRRLGVDATAFSLTTSPVQPRASRQLAVSAASLLVTTRTVGLIYGTTIGIAGASITVTAGTVGVRAQRLLRVAPAAMVATAGPVRLALQRRLRVAAASFAVTLAAVALRLASGFVPAPSAGRTITLVDRGSRTLILGDQGSRRLII